MKKNSSSLPPNWGYKKLIRLAKMGQNLIGIDFGSQAVKLVGLRLTAQGPVISHLALKAIPAEEEKDLDFGAELLKAIFLEADLKPKKVRFVFSGTGLHIRRLSLPAMPKKELKEAVRWEMKSLIPQPIEDMEVRFHVLGEKKAEKNTSAVDLIAVAIPQVMLERFFTIFEKSGIRPAHLGVTPFALWNLLLTCQEKAGEEDLAILDMGAEKTGIYIFQKGILQFSREIIPGGADFTRAIGEGLEPGANPQLLLSRAEKIKQLLGVPVKGPFASIPGESISIAKITFLMRPLLEKLVGEIARSLEYFRTQISGKNIDRLLLCGGGANMKNMDLYLAQELHLPVQRFHPGPHIPFDQQNIDGQLWETLGPQLAAALGVALPPIKELNFLPEKEPLVSRLRQGKNPYLLASASAAAIMALLTWGVKTDLAKVQKEYELKSAQLQKLERLPIILSALQEKEKQMKRHLLFFSTSSSGAFPSPRILAELRTIIPENITLTQLNIGPKGLVAPKDSSARKGEKEILITGLAFGHNAQSLQVLAQFMGRLERSSFFRNIKLISAIESKQYTSPAIQFEMVADLDWEKDSKG